MVRLRGVLALAQLIGSSHAAQLQAPAPIKAPLRELPWGQLNFLHTTDTHGWHAGHLQEPQYGADWGDYISFAEHMRAKADADGSDLLLVDTGDRVDGNGLYDASSPKGKFTREIFGQQDIDIITIGNHELYQVATSTHEYEDLIPRFKRNYLASNVDFIRSDGTQVAMAPRYKKFTTKNQGIRIVAFGFLFNFDRNCNVTVVKEVESVIKEKWFQEAIGDREVDLFVVAGHVALTQVEYSAIYEAIRKEQWDTPIQFFAGHAHVRGYKIFDDKAHAIASGRYFETVGFQSISGLSTGSSGGSTQSSIEFNRRYIDNNLFSYHQHTGTNSSTFPTERGQSVSAQIGAAREHLNLTKVYGCAPRSLWMNRAPYPHADSIFSWLALRVIPETIVDPKRADKPRILIANTGAIRFDLFKGRYTLDTTYMLSPFPGGFGAIHNVPFSIANRVAEALNKQAGLLGLADLEAPFWPQDPASMPPSLGPIQHPRIFETSVQKILRNDDNDVLIPGYTTQDDLGDDGDDTVHAPVQYYAVPNVIESRVHVPAQGEFRAGAGAGASASAGATAAQHEKTPDTVDLVYLDFTEPYVLAALNFFGGSYAEKDTTVYLNVTMNEAITQWVQKNWKCEEE